MFTSDNEQGLHNGAVDGGTQHKMTSVIAIYRCHMFDETSCIMKNYTLICGLFGNFPSRQCLNR